MLRVDGKVALITGAGSGIGRATAQLLAQAGAVSIVADVNLTAAQAVACEIESAGGKATALQLDVSQEADWQRGIDTVCAEHHRLDIVVNNAGIAFGKPTDETTLDEWRKVMSVNLDGVFLGTKWAIRAMKQRGGSIINVASVSGIKPSPMAGAYCSAKAAIRMLSRVAAIECADAKNGIRVNVVTPDAVKTPMWEQMNFFQNLVAQHGGTEQAFAAMSAGATASQQFLSPEQVAETILYLASDASAHLTGAEIVLDHGHTGK